MRDNANAFGGGRGSADELREKKFSKPVDEHIGDTNNSASRRGGNATTRRRKGCVAAAGKAKLVRARSSVG